MGLYHVLIINDQGELLDDVDCMELLEDIEENSLGLEGVFEPMITSVFLPDGNIIAINVFNRF